MTWIRLKVQDERLVLHITAHENLVGVVSKRIELGCNMNKTNSDGLAPLHHAAIYTGSCGCCCYVQPLSLDVM